MKLRIWQVDAFASKPLEGNPAAIVPLESWIDAGLMQAIAAENNVAETAYFVKTGAGAYDLRWFAPNREVDLCGHATLASAWIIFSTLLWGRHARGWRGKTAVRFTLVGFVLMMLAYFGSKFVLEIILQK